MKRQTVNPVLPIVLGVMLLILGYQFFFTDTYDGLFGSSQPVTTMPTPTAPQVRTDATVETVDPVQPPRPAAPLLTSDQARFRSDDLLRNLPTENPFKSIEAAPSALFEPDPLQPTRPLTPDVTGEFVETSDNDEAIDATAAPSVPVRTPQRLPFAPVARLTPPMPAAATSPPEPMPLFTSLDPAPLIRSMRVSAQSSEIPLPRSIPPAPVPSFIAPHEAAPALRATPDLASIEPYFGALPIFPIIEFSEASRAVERMDRDQPRPVIIRNLSGYFDDIELTFTGTARGSVTVGVFRSSLTLGPVVLAVGQTIPETDIMLTRLTTTEAEFTLGDQSRVLTLDLRW